MPAAEFGSRPKLSSIGTTSHHLGHRLNRVQLQGVGEQIQLQGLSYQVQDHQVWDILGETGLQSLAGNTQGSQFAVVFSRS